MTQHFREVRSDPLADVTPRDADDFTQAVDLLRRCLKQADPRHDPQFGTDLKNAWTSSPTGCRKTANTLSDDGSP